MYSNNKSRCCRCMLRIPCNPSLDYVPDPIATVYMAARRGRSGGDLILRVWPSSNIFLLVWQTSSRAPYWLTLKRMLNPVRMNRATAWRKKPKTLAQNEECVKPFVRTVHCIRHSQHVCASCVRYFCLKNIQQTEHLHAIGVCVKS